MTLNNDAHQVVLIVLMLMFKHLITVINSV